MGYYSVRGYVGTAIVRTVVWMSLVSLVAVCDDESHSAGLISKCTMHKSLRIASLGWIWIVSINAMVAALLACSIHNVFCNKQQQSYLSNILAPLTAALTFAGVGVSMGSVGVWWGFLGLPCFLLGPGIIIAVKGRSVLTRKFLLNILFRTLHTWDIVTDFATAVLLGADSTIGIIYIGLSVANLLMYIVSLYTQLGEDSLVRIVLNMLKALSLDLPMLVLDICVLFQGGRSKEEQAVIIVSAVSSLLESVASFKAAVSFHEVTVRHKKMKETITTAQGIAEALACFDIAAAEKLLPETVELPEHDIQLIEAYRKIIQNLKMYRPYLPDAMFTTKCPPPVKRPFGEFSTILPKNTEIGLHVVDISDQRTTQSVTPLLPVEPPIIVLTPPILPLVLEERNLTALVLRHTACKDVLSHLDISGAQRVASGFLESVFTEAKSFRGVIHSFDTGFEVVVTFGAVVDPQYPKSITNSASDAYACAVALSRKFRSNSTPLVGIGMASGPAIVGNLGAGDRLAFSIVGPVLHVARMACEHSLLSGETIVADPRMKEILGQRDTVASRFKSQYSHTLWGIDSFYVLSPCEDSVRDSRRSSKRTTSVSNISIHVGQQPEDSTLTIENSDPDVVVIT